MKRIVCAFWLIWISGSLMQAEQNASSATDILSSQRHALALLQQSIAAHGGETRLRQIRSYSIHATVSNQSIHQSARTQPPFYRWTDEAWYAVDMNADRFLVDSNRTFPSFRNHSRTVFNHGQGTLIDYLAETQVVETNLDGLRWLLTRILPHGILLQALDNRASLRWVGTSGSNIAPLQEISYVRPSGEIMTLAFDASSALLKQLKFLRADTIDGDMAGTYEYMNYRKQDGFVLPFSFKSIRGPWLAAEGEIKTVELSTEISDQEFTPPEFRAINTYDPPIEFDTIAPNVHIVRYVPGGYNVLCVEFSDYITVIETPEDNVPGGISRSVIDLIRKQIPKPIRYAVPTHHHSDHIGGIRDYLHEGATIVTTAGNEQFARRFVQQRSTLSTLMEPVQDSMLKFQFLTENDFLLKDDTQELHIYRIGPTPHVDDILIAYLPKQKILFQTDLFNAWSCFQRKVPNEDIGHTTALGDTQVLISAVESLHLKVETVYGGHGREVAYPWLVEFAARRKTDGKPMWACSAAELLQ